MPSGRRGRIGRRRQLGGRPGAADGHSEALNSGDVDVNRQQR